jgi:dTDP-4-amino-4,6-dideoxygalactose transaminase
MDVESVARLLNNPFIKERTKAIMPVHYAGLPVDMDKLYDLSNANRIDVIEDAAHAFGAVYKGDKIGTKYSRYVCFSLHSVKPFAVGDGGIMTTYAPEVAKQARLLRWFGINKATSDRFTKEGYKWSYDISCLGYKSHMNDITAAIGLGQLLHYEEDKAKRQALVDRYRERLESNDRLTPVNARADRISANYLFVVLCLTKEIKNALMSYLYDNDIQTGCHYHPNHLYKMYRHCETDNGCPEAIKFFEKAISLPLHVEMTLEDVDKVCDTINKFTKEMG